MPLAVLALPLYLIVSGGVGPAQRSSSSPVLLEASALPSRNHWNVSFSVLSIADDISNLATLLCEKRPLLADPQKQVVSLAIKFLSLRIVSFAGLFRPPVDHSLSPLQEEFLACARHTSFAMQAVLWPLFALVEIQFSNPNNSTISNSLIRGEAQCLPGHANIPNAHIGSPASTDAN
jgi:hypothetical protein